MIGNIDLILFIHCNKEHLRINHTMVCVTVIPTRILNSYNSIKLLFHAKTEELEIWRNSLPWPLF